MIGTYVRAVFASLLLTLCLQSQAFAWDNRPDDLFKMCTQCHGAQLQGNHETGAPSIAGLPEWYLLAQLDKFHTGARGANARDIGGMRMRPIGRTLEDDNRKEMAKYVAALPRPLLPDTINGNLVKGESRYQVCQACHGPKAEGNQQVGAPPLVGASDWYLLTQLKNFKNHARGYDPAADPNGAAMQGMAATLDDQGMLDVVAYINTFKPVK